ncbi:hypothetical protein [Acidithiobacillus ferrivorans]|nr:hypothetical protein [Acidithiobacillus ferrivorans]
MDANAQLLLEKAAARGMWAFVRRNPDGTTFVCVRRARANK